MRTKITLLCVLSILFSTFVGCDRLTVTPIAKIIDNPRDYDGRHVTISGEVTDLFSLFVVKCFVLKDSTGELTVVSKRALPKKGNSIKVSGSVQAAFSLGDKQLLVLVEDEPTS